MRPIGSQVTRTRDAQPPEPTPLTDPATPWRATLVQPYEMQQASTQTLVADVTGPVPLDGTVTVTLTHRTGHPHQTFPARWQGDVGNARQAHALLTGVTLTGWCHVTIAPGVGTERPRLHAGSIRVRP